MNNNEFRTKYLLKLEIRLREKYPELKEDWQIKFMMLEFFRD